MNKILFTIFVSVLLAFSVNAQTGSAGSNTSGQKTPASGETKRKTFRATKDQVTQAQKMLKEKGRYAGAEDGKYNVDLRTSIKQFQGENGLKKTGTLNRATLEKMGIALTDAQKEIPVPADSFASADDSKASETRKRGPVFRATKEQINQAQKMLKDGGMYAGEQTGKLDDATREGLKKYQTANGLKATGTLNRATLEKMGIALTDRQKENSQSN